MAAKNRRAFELRLGKLGLILFVGGGSLVLFSTFLLGIFVGQQMEAYPEKYAAGMTDLIYERLFAPVTRRQTVPPAAQGAKDETAGSEEGFGLTFYDTLAGKKREAVPGKGSAGEKDAAPAVVVPSPIVPKPASPAGEATAVGRPAAAERPGAAAGHGGEMPLPEKRTGREPLPGAAAALPPTAPPTAPAAAPAAAPPATESAAGEARPRALFEIQVAAYQESRKAEQIMEKLAPLGYASRVVVKELPGKGKWYRVIIGGFESREKARAAADQIAGKIRGVKCVVRSAS